MAKITFGPTLTTTAVTHYGEWNDESRKIPALSFFEKYDAVVKACEFSGPFHNWFAPSARFEVNTGTTYHSGSEIWEWMKSPALFGRHAKVSPHNRISTVLLNGHDKGDRLIHQQDMVFFPKEGPRKADGISVRRTIEFVSGPSEVRGQGTDGLQYFVGKTFWDTSVLIREVGHGDNDSTHSMRPIGLISVNKTPARATILVERLLHDIGMEKRIKHTFNSTNIQDVRVLLECSIEPPSILICSSQWTLNEQREINAIATQVIPTIKLVNIPPNLDAAEGSEGIIKYLTHAFRSLELA